MPRVSLNSARILSLRFIRRPSVDKRLSVFEILLQDTLADLSSLSANMRQFFINIIIDGKLDSDGQVTIHFEVNTRINNYDSFLKGSMRTVALDAGPNGNLVIHANSLQLNGAKYIKEEIAAAA